MRGGGQRRNWLTTPCSRCDFGASAVTHRDASLGQSSNLGSPCQEQTGRTEDRRSCWKASGEDQSSPLCPDLPCMKAGVCLQGPWPQCSRLGPRSDICQPQNTHSPGERNQGTLFWYITDIDNKILKSIILL